MKVIRTTREAPPAGSKLRNFDLSVEEIRIMRALKANGPDPARLDFYSYEIKKLEEQLDDIREHTLIR
jgi:hypothetical protein